MSELLLRRRTLMMAQKRLPSEYQEVKYLESTGTQYIDTGVVPDQNTDLDLGGIDLSQTSGSVRFGSRTAQNVASFMLISTSLNQLRFDYGTEARTYTFTGKYDRFLFDHTSRVGTAYRNGVVLESIGYSSSVFSGIYDLCLFGSSNGGVVTPAVGYKTRYCIIRQSDVLVRNFIPCYRKSDNKPGMYDLVTKTFFTNQGTGEFIVGADVN